MKQKRYQVLVMEVFRFTKEDLFTVSTNDFDMPFRQDTDVNE